MYPVSFLKMKNWIIIVNIMIRVMTEKGLSGNALGKKVTMTSDTVTLR